MLNTENKIQQQNHNNDGSAIPISTEPIFHLRYLFDLTRHFWFTRSPHTYTLSISISSPIDRTGNKSYFEQFYLFSFLHFFCIILYPLECKIFVWDYFSLDRWIINNSIEKPNSKFGYNDKILTKVIKIILNYRCRKERERERGKKLLRFPIEKRNSCRER